MSSMGFSYAQIHVRQERCRSKSRAAEEKERRKKASEEAAMEEESKHPAAGGEKKAAGGCSWAGRRVRPCGGAEAAAGDGGR
ncbi:hypothetical protein ACP70R_019304 [Stipagrostis hirtigluma subsp. patula]